MGILVYGLSLSGLLCMILASLVKGEKMRLTLLLVFLGNFLVGTSYLFDGKGINGAAALYLGAVQTIINYFFDSKNKPLPKWLILCYAVAIIVLNIAVVGKVTALGVLVIIASLTFIFCIGQKNGAGYRFWTIINMLLWCLYDVLSGVYSALITHGALLIFTVAGMIMHDKKITK